MKRNSYIALLSILVFTLCGCGSSSDNKESVSTITTETSSQNTETSVQNVDTSENVTIDEVTEAAVSSSMDINDYIHGDEFDLDGYMRAYGFEYGSTSDDPGLVQSYYYNIEDNHYQFMIATREKFCDLFVGVWAGSDDAKTYMQGNFYSQVQESKYVTAHGNHFSEETLASIEKCLNNTKNTNPSENSLFVGLCSYSVEYSDGTVKQYNSDGTAQ